MKRRVGIATRAVRAANSNASRPTGGAEVTLSSNFSAKCRGTFSRAQIQELVTLLMHNPRAGERLGLGELHRLPWPAGASRSRRKDVYYVYHSAPRQLQLLDVFAEGEKGVLTKLVINLAEEIGPA